jgi:hypothetical protein
VKRSAAWTLFVLVACTGPSQDDEGTTTEAATEAHWWSEDDLQEAIVGYESWTQLEPWVGIHPNSDGHGLYIQIWVNALAAEGLAEGSGKLPDGAAFVKETYAVETGGTPDEIAALWIHGEGVHVWGQKLGDAEWSIGMLDACESCHGPRPNNLWAWD